MQNDFYKNLKSGTDVRGVAVETNIETQGARLTASAAYDIAAAFILWLKRQNNTTTLSLAVGHDSRITAPIFVNAIHRAFVDYDCKAHLCGLITTPAMFMMTKFDSTNCDGVIMITASHHPYYMNGMKFFTKLGGISSRQLEEILALASELRTKHGQAQNTGLLQTACKESELDFPLDYKQHKKEYISLYADLLKAQICEFASACDRPLSGMKIVVDAGNGAAGFFASMVLEPLGADVSGSQFLDADGYFPNHVPNPEDRHAISSIKDCVVRNRADLGIIFDTDGDRVGIVTADGNEINRNRLIAASAALLLERPENCGAYIVTDSVTSEGLREFITKMGGNHLRFRRGYKNVIDKAIQLLDEGKNACLAIETSGHAAFRENYFLDDGAYLAVRLIAKAVELKRDGKQISELIAGLREPIESIEARLTLCGNDWKAQAERIINDLTIYAQECFIPATDNHEGIRAVIPECEGWFLLRLSVHDPVMPLNIESDKAGGAREIATKLKKFFSRYPSLDTTKL